MSGFFTALTTTSLGDFGIMVVIYLVIFLILRAIVTRKPATAVQPQQRVSEQDLEVPYRLP